jgi:hypothetical protein
MRKRSSPENKRQSFSSWTNYLDTGHAPNHSWMSANHDFTGIYVETHLTLLEQCEERRARFQPQWFFRSTLEELGCDGSQKVPFVHRAVAHTNRLRRLTTFYLLISVNPPMADSNGLPSMAGHVIEPSLFST